MSEREKKEKLFELMKNNPDLPVVAMVDSDVVAGDGFGWWMGSWGYSGIDEYILTGEGVHFRDDKDDEEINKVLSEQFGCDYYLEIDTPEKEKQAYAELPWIKAIIVSINLPE